jgi:hypothetical protein
MKTVLMLFFNLMIFCLFLQAQTVYKVSPNTSGNKITLTIENESSENSAKNVTVKLAKQSDVLKFESKEIELEEIKSGSSQDVTFMFAINREAEVNQQDTLEFLISDLNGEVWEKSIILFYTPPSTYRLEQNYPNPFNPVTFIQYQLPIESSVKIQLYDLLGREVKTLISKDQPAGYHEVKLNASDLASGIYIYRITAGPFTSAKKLIVMK